MSLSAQRGRIVIAGGCGFLGVSLSGYLAGLGHEVVVLSRRAPGGPGSDGAEAGFEFRFPTLGPALADLYGRGVKAATT